jgi:hypothetical protein
VDVHFHPADPARFEAALRRFDEANGRDPNRVGEGGAARPRELAYADWLSAWVLRLSPGASEELRLASRCQHLCRWEIPRESYPATRTGYLKWRENLKQFHASRAGEILRECGYPESTVARVQQLVRKENFKADGEGQVIEDALCLVFLERQLGDLAAKSTEDKVINALRKSWDKMSPAGREAAKGLALGPRETALIQMALK